MLVDVTSTTKGKAVDKFSSNYSSINEIIRIRY
jgi:hypothetical protein